jgi:RNA polymerase subunit RPABC4/transcription elongation factor Spt4
MRGGISGEICPECGEPVTRDTEFCPRCGAFIDWDDADRNAVEQQKTEVPPDGAAAGTHSDVVPETAPVPPPRDPAADRRTAAQRVGVGPAAAGGDVPGVRPTEVQPTVAEPAESGCRRCGTENPPELRFCRKCGLEFATTRVPTPWDARPRPRLPWWRRLFGGSRTTSERAALRAYRRSLPTRYRLFRAAAALLAVLLVVGAVLAVRGDPIGWARARWYDVKDTVAPVRGVMAATDPADAVIQDFPPDGAIDRNPKTAWATTWVGKGDSKGCGVPQTNAALLLTLDRAVDLRRVRVLGGLPAGDPDRLAQHRPKVIEMRFSDGRCVPLTLKDSGEMQTLDVQLKEPVSTTIVRIDVVDIFATQGAKNVAVSEVELLERPLG